jgi:hypothetical protein
MRILSIALALLLVSTSAWATDKKISALSSAGAVDYTETTVLVQSGASVKAALSAFVAPVASQYWTGAADSVLSAEKNLGALGTGLVINTAGVPSILTTQTCTNQVVRILSASGTATCATITSSFVDTTVWTGTASSGMLKASSQGVLTAGTKGTDYVDVGTANSWTDDIRQTFNPGANASGINVGAAASAPGTPVNGDVYYDSALTAFQLRENGTWRGLGITTEVLDLQGTFALGKAITGADSFADRFEIGDGTAAHGTIGMYTDATLGPQINCVVSGVENDCNYTRWLNTGKTFTWLANDRTTAIGTVTSAASSGSWTNMTIDAEATGNTITTVSKVNFPTVGCSGTSGSLLWDTNATLAPTATCTAGATNTTLIQGYADFPDVDGDYSLQTQAFRIPSDWSGAVDVQAYWKAAATSGNVVWQIATMCTADAEIEDVAWNTADHLTADTAKGTTLQLNTVAKTGITMTGCSAGELIHIKFLRNRTDASDTIAGVVSLKSVELTFRRAQ